MKQILIVLAALVAFAGSRALSQDKPKAPDRIDRTMVLLTKQLLLSPDQQKAVRQILTETNKQLADSRSAYTGKPQEMRTAMQTVRANSDARIEELLNPAQKTAFEKYKERRKTRMRDPMSEGEGSRQ